MTGAVGPQRQETSQHVGVLVRATADASHRPPPILGHDAEAREDGEVNVSRNGLPLAYAKHRSLNLEHDHPFLLRREARCERGKIVHPRPNATSLMRPESDEIASSRLGHARVNGKNDAFAAPAVLSA